MILNRDILREQEASKPYISDEQKARYEQYELESAWPNARGKRDTLLKQSDWVMLQGVPMSEEKKQQWIEYRKALRDVPQTYQTVESIVWPTAPQ